MKSNFNSQKSSNYNPQKRKRFPRWEALCLLRDDDDDFTQGMANLLHSQGGNRKTAALEKV